MSENKIFDAVKQLSVDNDNHWTTEGLPRLDTVKMLAADPTLTREKIEAAVPGFKRVNAAEYTLSETTADNAGQGTDADIPLAVAPELATEQVAQTEELPPVEEAPKADASLEGTAPASGASEAQLSSLENGSAGDSDALEALEAELEEASSYSAKLKEAADHISAELEKSVRYESELREKIEAARPRNGVMPAIQAYFAAQDAVANDVAALRKVVVESGLDISKIQTLLGQSPIDKASAQANK